MIPPGGTAGPRPSLATPMGVPAVEVRVGVAAMATGADGQCLVTVGLGSCVAILLHDGDARVGGLAHILLPSPSMSRDRDNVARFPETAVPELLSLMVDMGAVASRVTGKLVGGASMFRSLLARNGENVGERNTIASRTALDVAGIALVAEDVGGEHGRSVYFDVATGSVWVRSIVGGDRVL